MHSQPTDSASPPPPSLYKKCIECLYETKEFAKIFCNGISVENLGHFPNIFLKYWIFKKVFPLKPKFFSSFKIIHAFLVSKTYFTCIYLYNTCNVKKLHTIDNTGQGGGGGVSRFQRTRPLRMQAFFTCSLRGSGDYTPPPLNSWTFFLPQRRLLHYLSVELLMIVVCKTD